MRVGVFIGAFASAFVGLAALSPLAQAEAWQEMVTDKAAFTVPAPASGTITEILAPEGAKVQVGEVMAHIQQ